MRRTDVLALLLAVWPVVFVWTAELTFYPYSPSRDLVLFVWPVSGLAAYHAAMYILFVVNWVAAYYLTGSECLT